MRLATPEALALLILVPLVFWAMRGRARPVMLFSGLELVRPAGKTLRQRVAWLPRVLRAAAVIALVVALARPQTGLGEVRTTANGVAMVMVVDRSYSMIDTLPYQGETISRIRAVKRVFKDFVEGDGKNLAGRPEDLIGLVTFAKYADTVAPLTRSHEALSKLVETIQLAGERDIDAGTAIGEGLAIAAARLKQAEEDIERIAREQATQGPTPNQAAENAKPDANSKPKKPEADFTIKSKIIVLMTDGDENTGEISARQAADLAKQWGIKIYAIGIGDNAGGNLSVRGPFGNMRVAGGFGGFNDQLLKDIAKDTGGKYYAATDGESLKQVYADIDALEKTEIKSTEYTSYRESFWWWAAGGGAALALEMLLAGTLLRRVP